MLRPPWVAWRGNVASAVGGPLLVDSQLSSPSEVRGAGDAPDDLRFVLEQLGCEVLFLTTIARVLYSFTVRPVGGGPWA